MPQGPDMSAGIDWIRRNNGGRRLREAHAAITILGLMHAGVHESHARRDVLNEYRRKKGESVPGDSVGTINHLVNEALKRQRQADAEVGDRDQQQTLAGMMVPRGS